MFGELGIIGLSLALAALGLGGLVNWRRRRHSRPEGGVGSHAHA